MDEKLITVGTYRLPIDAHLAKSFLESEEIECFLENEDMNWLYSGVIAVDLKVKKSDVKRALEILKDLK